uniref:TSA: Wollemia nobilis Ref_Wollemi_Transcript_28848_2164 transcribed RNA sequence n=1 Tax=Wollemia nobilis TaxID=56998 RepID=A0A0C9RPM6_9CONI
MEQLVNFVIRPPRADYSPTHDLLEQEFLLKGCRFRRKDIEVINDHGNVLQCSHYMPHPMPEGRALPCVIYCHGNSGCRADANEAAVILLPSYITVFTLDFSGSGLSEGEHVTLGWREKDDLKAVVRSLREDTQVSLIGLWGRSMGAVTSLLYGAEDPSIAGMVLDSPFANLVDLMMALVDVYKIRLPKFTVKVAVQYMRKAIQKKAHFDIMDLDVVQVAAKSFIPALFGHATEDLFIQPHHSDLIYKSYAGDKNIIKFEGDHNSPRPQFYYDSITIFFHNVLHPPDGLVEAHASGCLYEYIDEFENLDENVWHDIMSDQGITSNGIDTLHQPNHCEFNANSTEDAINHSRARWQMSRTEVPANFADDSENNVNFLHLDELNGVEMVPSNTCDAEGRIKNSLQGRENGNPESSSSKSHDISNRSSEKLYSDILVTRETSNQLANCPADSFAQFPLTTEDEEKMLLEAITASLRDLETTHISQDQTSEVEENKPCPMASETAFRDTSEGSEKENFTSEEKIVCANDPQAHSGSPGRTEAETEEKCSNMNPSISVLEGLTHRWGSLFRKRQE